MQSAEARLHEALEALKKAGKLETFREQSIACSSGVEPRLNLALELLKESGPVLQKKIDEFKERQFKTYRDSGMSEAAARAMANLAGR